MRSLSAHQIRDLTTSERSVSVRITRVPAVLGVALDGLRPFKELVAELHARSTALASHPKVIGEILAYRACRSAYCVAQRHTHTHTRTRCTLRKRVQSPKAHIEHGGEHHARERVGQPPGSRTPNGSAAAAVKFGDALSRAQAESILRRLSQCELPFICGALGPSVSVTDSTSSTRHVAASVPIALLIPYTGRPTMLNLAAWPGDYPQACASEQAHD